MDLVNRSPEAVDHRRRRSEGATTILAGAYIPDELRPTTSPPTLPNSEYPHPCESMMTVDTICRTLTTHGTSPKVLEAFFIHRRQKDGHRTMIGPRGISCITSKGVSTRTAPSTLAEPSTLSSAASASIIVSPGSNFLATHSCHAPLARFPTLELAAPGPSDNHLTPSSLGDYGMNFSLAILSYWNSMNPPCQDAE